MEDKADWTLQIFSDYYADVSSLIWAYWVIAYLHVSINLTSTNCWFLSFGFWWSGPVSLSLASCSLAYTLENVCWLQMDRFGLSTTLEMSGEIFGIGAKADHSFSCKSKCILDALSERCWHFGRGFLITDCYYGSHRLVYCYRVCGVWHCATKQRHKNYGNIPDWQWYFRLLLDSRGFPEGRE